MERAIQIAVARADIALCEIARNIPTAIAALLIGLFIGVRIYKKLN